MSEYKNPCWLEHLLREHVAEYANTSFHQYGKNEIVRLRQIYQERLRTEVNPWRLRCLPYFYLAGVTKSGTTDLFEALLKHPQIHGPWVKEPHYWNRRRYPKGVPVRNGLYGLSVMTS